jgi:peroxiredoxin
MMKKLLLSIIPGLFLFSNVLSQPDSTTLVRTGEKTPLFTCTTIDGKTIDISKLKGKIVLINFFATWCPPCNQELPELQKNIWDKYKNNPDFVLVIIGREHNEKEVKDFVTKKQFTMPFAPDPGRKIFSLYATQSIPRNIIIGKDGRVLFHGIGFAREEFIKMEELLAENLK